jgi:5-formyltetrahydrofolate cyclo-ligase
VPIKDEVDIRPLLTELLTRGVALYLPCFEKILAFRRVTDLASLVPGELKIPEPPPESDELDPAILDIAIVPGRAFDAHGGRLGRGNGGYDRWIHVQRATNARTQYWAVAFECQMVDIVPMEPHDERIDAVVTDRGVLPTKH